MTLLPSSFSEVEVTMSIKYLTMKEARLFFTGVVVGPVLIDMIVKSISYE